MRHLTIACLLAFAGTAVAQSDSHIRIDNWGGGRHDPRALEDQLKQRLKPRPGPAPALNGMDPKLVEQIKNMILQDPEKWNNILESQLAGAENSELRQAIQRGALDNPALKNQLFNRGNPGDELSDPSQRGKFEDRLKELGDSVRSRSRNLPS